MTELRNMLVDLAKAERKVRKQVGQPVRAYAGPCDFVLKEGVDYTVRSPAAYAVTGPPNRCYGNALFIATVLGLPYVEGMAMTRPGMPPLAHAWNLDPAGRVIDATWISTPIGHGVAYRGVVFDPVRADIATWDEDSHVLRWHPNPLYDEPWTGEHEWEENERVAVHRRGSYEEAVALHDRMDAEAKAEALDTAAVATNL